MYIRTPSEYTELAVSMNWGVFFCRCRYDKSPITWGSILGLLILQSPSWRPRGCCKVLAALGSGTVSSRVAAAGRPPASTANMNASCILFCYIPLSYHTIPYHVMSYHNHIVSYSMILHLVMQASEVKAFRGVLKGVYRVPKAPW